jgi:hypothetical protein
MGGEVVLSRWLLHLSGARYWIDGMILHQLGEMGRDRFLGGEHQALAIEIAAIQTKSAFADWCLLMIGFYFFSFESLLISIIKS